MAPLSEHSLLHLTSVASRHLPAYAGERPSGTPRWGATARQSSSSTRARRQGLGSALWEAAVTAGADRAWAHGDLPSAAGLAAAYGLDRVRELHRMTRELTAADVAPVELPSGFTARTFEPGRDEQAWLETNAAAFATHPEQGSLTREDLDQRMAQDWFDPADLSSSSRRPPPDGSPRSTGPRSSPATRRGGPTVVTATKERGRPGGPTVVTATKERGRPGGPTVADRDEGAGTTGWARGRDRDEGAGRPGGPTVVTATKERGRPGGPTVVTATKERGRPGGPTVVTATKERGRPGRSMWSGWTRHTRARGWPDR